MISIVLNKSALKSEAYYSYTARYGFHILPNSSLFFGEPYKISIGIAQKKSPSKAQQDALYELIQEALFAVGAYFASHGSDGFAHRFTQQHNCSDDIKITRGGPAFILLVVLKLFEDTKDFLLKVRLVISHFLTLSTLMSLNFTPIHLPPFDLTAL